MVSEFRSDVYSREIDLSQVVRLTSNSFAICVGRAAQGPVDPVFVSNFDEWVQIYGEPRSGLRTCGTFHAGMV